MHRPPEPDTHDPSAPRDDALDDREPAASATLIEITVARTGGIAGRTRTWSVTARGDGTAQWITLIEQCPWDAESDTPTRGADRFVWTVDAVEDERARSAEIDDGDLAGAWRELIDAVRDADDEAPAPPQPPTSGGEAPSAPTEQ